MSRHLNASCQVVTLIVGGIYYSLLLSDIQAHKESYFASVIKDEWKSSDQPIVIDRDGILFQHIFVYLYNCRYNLSFALKGPLSLLVHIRREADYYNLPNLVALCDKTCNEGLQNWCKTQPLRELCDSYRIALQSKDYSELEALVNSEVYPGCQSGILDRDSVGSHYLTNGYNDVFAEINIPKVLERARPVSGDGVRQIMHKVLEAPHTISWNISQALLCASPTLQNTNRFVARENVFAVTKDGFLHADPESSWSPKSLGKILCILNSPHTGGTITATRMGVRKSITHTGEYIVYSSDHTLDVDTVTSGTLVYAVFDIISEMEIDMECVMQELIPFDILPTKDALIHAVHRELNHVSSTAGSVVLCLSDLYPIVEFEPSIPYLETDPDCLTGRDAVLYEYLKDTFEVTLVTVYVQRQACKSIGCVLGPAPFSDDAAGKKVKIIAPFHGLTELFPVPSKANTGSVDYASLYTALYLTNHNENH